MRKQSRLFTAASLTLLLGACSGSGDDGTVKPTGPNIQISFTASANSVAQGGAVTLNWAITGVETVTVNIDATPGGSVVADRTDLTGMVDFLNVDADTSFKLVATSGGATKEATVQVTIDPDGITINSFVATPNPAPTGGSVVLSWNVAGATQIRVVEGATELINTTMDVTTGAVSATVDNPTHTFRLEAQNASTAAQEEVTVTTAPPPAIDYFRVTPPTFNGASVDTAVTWTASGDLTLNANGTPVATFPGTETGTITVTVMETTIFELVAAGAGQSLRQERVVARATTEVEPNDDASNANAMTESAVSGTLTDENDVDFYSFTVPANGNVFLQVNDEAGYCSNDADVVLIDTDGTTELGTTGFGGDCPAINPADQSFAAQLPAGTYYARVESFFGGSGNYTLIVLVNSAGCGNGITEDSVGEQCDDGNTTDGDGCSSTCQVTSAGIVTGLGQNMTFSGSIDPAMRQDFYQIVMPSDGVIYAETGVPTIGVCEGDGMKDTRIYLLDSTFAELGDNDDGGPSLCSSIDPNVDDFATVTAGTYYLRVQSYGGNSVIPAYQVRIQTAGIGCGDGVVEMAEVCDDLNTMDGDGCSSTCTVEPDGSLSASGNVSVMLRPATGFPNFVEVVIGEAGSTITATITDGAGSCPVPTNIGLFDAALTMQFGGNGGGTGCASFGPPEDTFSADLPAGTYLIGIAPSMAATSVGAATLEVTIDPPVCGNSRIEGNANEQCDDGNTATGDGCDASCQFEGVNAETEANDMQSTANATGATRGGPAVTFAGAINPVGDHDYYSFEIPTGQTGTLSALTYGALGDISVCGFDTVLTVFDSAMTEIASNDDAGRGFCSTIDATTMGATGLAAGTYFIRVQDYDDNNTINAYLLDVQILP